MYQQRMLFYIIGCVSRRMYFTSLGGGWYLLVVPVSFLDFVSQGDGAVADNLGHHSPAI